MINLKNGYGIVSDGKSYLVVLVRTKKITSVKLVALHTLKKC